MISALIKPVRITKRGADTDIVTSMTLSSRFARPGIALIQISHKNCTSKNTKCGAALDLKQNNSRLNLFTRYADKSF